MDGGLDHGASDLPANAERRLRLFGQGVVRSIVFFANKNRALLEIGGVLGILSRGAGTCCPEMCLHEGRAFGPCRRAASGGDTGDAARQGGGRTPAAVAPLM